MHFDALSYLLGAWAGIWIAVFIFLLIQSMYLRRETKELARKAERLQEEHDQFVQSFNERMRNRETPTHN